MSASRQFGDANRHTQLLLIRLLTGFGAGFAVAAPFPIAAELMRPIQPKSHPSYTLVNGSPAIDAPVIGSGKCRLGRIGSPAITG